MVIRRNRPKVALGLLVFVVYVACSIIPRHKAGTYAGTVVDGETGVPIEGAVVVVVWHKCHLWDVNGCGLPHSIREAVTGPSGEFSISAVADPNWNPTTYMKHLWPYILIYALDYLPLSTNARTVSGFDEGAVAFEQAMRRNPRIPLARRNPLARGGRYEELERHAEPPLPWSPQELDARHLERAVDEQQQRIWKARAGTPTR